MGPHFKYLEPPTPELLTYATTLYSRLDDAQIVPPAEVSIGKWAPEPNMCHDNAAIWADNNPEFTAVRGWLYFPLGNASWCRFVAHSVVAHDDGRLFDITPSGVQSTYRFIASGLSDTEFKEVERILIRNFGDAVLDYWHNNQALT